MHSGLVADPRPRERAIRHTWDRVVVVVVRSACDEPTRFTGIGTSRAASGASPDLIAGRLWAAPPCGQHLSEQLLRWAEGWWCMGQSDVRPIGCQEGWESDSEVWSN